VEGFGDGVEAKKGAWGKVRCGEVEEDVVVLEEAGEEVERLVLLGGGRIGGFWAIGCI